MLRVLLLLEYKALMLLGYIVVPTSLFSCYSLLCGIFLIENLYKINMLPTGYSSIAILSVLWQLIVALPSPDTFTLTWKRQDSNETFNATTTFYIYNCDGPNQVSIIKQAHIDALTLANAAFDEDTETLSGNPHQFIDFTTWAAIDYWGPPDFKPSQQQRIYDTLYRATQSYPGWGISDWWNSRYMEIHCSDFAKSCVDPKTGAKYAAYTSQTDPNTHNPRRHPWINYCPGFFDVLKSHSDAVADIQNDSTGQKKLNAKNMRSRGM
jgi:hypothetical protein